MKKTETIPQFYREKQSTAAELRNLRRLTLQKRQSIKINTNESNQFQQPLGGGSTAGILENMREHEIVF